MHQSWHAKNTLKNSNEHSFNFRPTRPNMVYKYCELSNNSSKKFFLHHDHLEYSQITVKHHEHEEEHALVSQDYWQVNPIRHKLIKHSRDVRINLHDITLANPKYRFQKNSYLRKENLILSTKAESRLFTRTNGKKRR